MRAKDLKIGAECAYGGQRVVVEEITKVKSDTYAICRDQDGNHHRSWVGSLTPWAEYQAEVRIRQAEIMDGVWTVDQIREAVGGGVVIGHGTEDNPNYISAGSAILGFTEPAADKVLELCDAKPLPDNRRPSLSKSDEEWVKRSSLLGTRLRRALGIGKSSQYTGAFLVSEGKYVAARLSFYGDELQELKDKLCGTSESPDILAELIS